ncbi:hypothetical protein JB92DRAFT_2606857, partial [Gautieria morchelliformis]
PTTPPAQDDHEWITAYLTIHQLSTPSYLYTYLFWLAVVLVVLVFAVLHWTGGRGGVIGGIWSKWSLRRRTWRKQHSLAEARRQGKPHKQPLSLPSNAQLLSLAVLYVATILLCFLGPDYIAPGTRLWSLTSNPDPTPTNSTTSQPDFTIPKAWWTSGGRTGTLAFALFPLCVLLALKSPPFALFALPFLIQIYNDKLAFLHRWTGRLIWFVTALHVALWGVQLSRDKRSSDDPSSVWNFAFGYDKFVFGWIGFISLTTLTALSLRPIRTDFYEAFYILHVLLVPLTLVFSALHFPPVGWWCWAALAVWGAERFWRLVRFLRINDIIGGNHSGRNKRYRQETAKSLSPRSVVPKPEFPPYGFVSGYPTHTQFPSQSRAPEHNAKGSYLPPPGYAHCTLLPGRTIRLKLIPSRHFTWAPGQHILLNIPSVSKFTSHPFTIASICDKEASSDDGQEVIILIRARLGFTKELWSYIERHEDLGKIGDTPPHSFSPPRGGILLRTYIDGPFGSSIRARWTSYSTVLVIAGGSGVSFAVSVLEYACMCMAGRNGAMLGGVAGGWSQDAISQISRVRFVWIIREFSHIQWVAAVLRRCMAMVPTSALQVDIFVTNVVSRAVPAPLEHHSHRGGGDTLAPPSPYFAQSMKSRRQSNASDISMDSSISSSTFTDAPYMMAPESESGHEITDIVDMYGELGHEEHVLDLTNFDGEDDTRLPGESQLSYRLRKEGKVRRAKTRQSQRSLLPKLDTGRRTAQARLSSQRQHSHLNPACEVSGSHPQAFPGDLAQWSEIPPDSFMNELPNPSSPGGNVVNPQSLYPDPGDTSKKLDGKSEVSRPQDSESRQNGYHPRRSSRFGMDEAEAEDMPIVAERARPGKAKIDRIVAEEAGISRGAMVVACCGPTSLNAMVRKSVAAQINPSRLFRGDQPSITLVSEDFEW